MVYIVLANELKKSSKGEEKGEGKKMKEYNINEVDYYEGMGDNGNQLECEGEV